MTNLFGGLADRHRRIGRERDRRSLALLPGGFFSAGER
jgi:hypothetical protein